MESLNLIITAIALFACISVIGQPLPEPAKRTIQGMVVTEIDCPIMLSDASMEVVENQPPPHRSVIVQQQVKITNNADRDIKRIGLAFILESNNGGGVNHLTVEDRIQAGEARSSIHNLTVKGLSPRVDEILKVRITGISFRDGSRWVPPRVNEYLLHSQILLKGKAPLQIVDYRQLENDYRLKLKVVADNIVAYRLGVVKDTPQEFAVKLGEWINLDATNAVKGKETEISAHANQTGFKPEDIYKLEYFTRYSRTGRAITSAHGVAFFVAEVKLADGKVWQQTLGREFLIWDE